MPPGRAGLDASSQFPYGEELSVFIPRNVCRGRVLSLRNGSDGLLINKGLDGGRTSVGCFIIIRCVTLIMGPRKQVDTGGLPFREIRSGGKYYVDKSMLIADILGTNDRGVYLFTRPRRFGKTTNITMLDAFFNMRYEGNTWFDGLAISEHHEYDRYRNSFPVIRLDLKDTESSTERDYLDAVNTAVINAMDPFTDLLEGGRLNRAEVLAYERIASRSASREELKSSVQMLCRILERRTGRKVIVLIDEYDRAVTNAFGTELQAFIVDFLGGFLSSTLKSNDSLQMAYITGVMQVAKAGMSSGPNNLSVDTVFSTRSDERFGFTESETRTILKYYGHPEKFDEVREWYDGYRFGDAEVYNPFSVMSYVSHSFEPKGFWINSGKDVAIRWMLERVSVDNIGTVANIVNGDSSEVELHDSMTFDDLRLVRLGDLYSLMVMTGYLKAEPSANGLHRISLPNAEVGQIVDRLLNENIRLDNELFDRFNTAVLNADAEGMADSLQRILVDASYYILRDEISYETILLTIMHGLLGNYRVRAEHESGNGRADLILTPRREGMVPMIFELKVASSEDVLEKEAYEGLRQIHDRKYYLGMNGDVVLVGVAFWGKVPRAVTETVSLRRHGTV